jgi:cation diffusion facilitator CzcD-associated flavoprotein CzcO
MTQRAPLIAAPPSVAIIGAGFGGLAAAHYLKQAGIESFTVYEKAGDLGGVWRENTYPGAACDIPSHLYSYSFERHYPWRSRFAGQPEILAYLHDVAERRGLLPHVRFNKALRSAVFDEAQGVWRLEFSDGERAEANVLVSAVGQLHRPVYPAIEGRERFQGRAFHSAHWDHAYDFAGKQVAVIGTGASAVQFVPVIARQVGKLYVLQRSPGWCIPKFERRFNRFERALLRYVPFVQTLDRWRIFWLVEFLGSAMVRRSFVARIAGGYLRATARLLMRVQVRDAALRRRLTPDSPVGCKRTLLSNAWLAALARDNVELVDTPVRRIVDDGVEMQDGRRLRVDAIVYGTGFAATQFLAPMEVLGIGGRSIHERWAEGASAYLGLSVPQFPNLLLMYGPNTNLGGGSIVYMLERQAEYIVQYVQMLQKLGLRHADVREDVHDAYNRELQQRNAETAFEAGCHSWYIGADGRNLNNWTGLMHEYGRRVRTLRPQDYRHTPLFSDVPPLLESA